MDALEIVYAILLVASVAVQGALVVFAWRQRATPGAWRFIWFVGAACFTALTYLGLALAPNPTIGFIWARLRFLGMSLVAVHYVLFVLEYAGYRARRAVPWIYVFPALVQLVIWTNAWHDLFFTDWQLEDRGWLSAEVSAFGIGHWAYSLVSYLLIAVGFAMLWQRFFQAKGVFRRQLSLLLLGSSVAILVSIPGTVGLSRPPFNAFPVGSIVIGLYFAWALFRYGLLDLVPVAHETVFRSLRDMALVLDRHNRIVDMNPAALALVGRTEAQVVGRPIDAVFAAWPALVAALQEPDYAEIPLDDSTYLALHPSALADRAGDPSGFVIILRDITKRKQAEASLAERNRVLHMLHDMATEIGTEIGPGVLLQHILQRAIDLLDADRGGSIHIYHPESDMLVMEAGIGINEDRVHTVVKPGSGVTGRVFESAQPLIVNDYTHWEGRTVVIVPSPPSAVMGIPLLIRGQVVGVLVVAANSARRTFDDEDARVAIMFAAQAATAIQNAQSFQRAQYELEERRRTEAALRAEKEFSDAMLDATPDTVFVFNPQTGRALRWNKAFAAMSGYTDDEIAARKAPDDWYSPSDLQRAAAAIASLEQDDHVVVELALKRKDGTIIPVEYVAAPIRDDAGRFRYVVAIGRDITERKEIEQHKLTVAVEREKIKLLADFITMAAHEFRTPLSTININLSLLDHTPDLAARDKRLNTIKQQLTYIANLINTMLKMTRLDSKTALTLIPTQLNTMLRDVETRYRSLVEGCALTLAVDLAPDLPLVPVNVSVLYDALSCLLDNALNHTPEGGTITLRSYADAKAVVIEVIDTGEGIGADDLPHIFERFYRVDEARSTRGAGLGLSIVRRAVDLHFGQIEVESEIGQGSTFRVRLPCDHAG